MYGQESKEAIPAAAQKKEPSAVSAESRFIDLFKPFQTDNAALSPDGKYLAFSLREGETLSIAVLEIDKPSSLTAKVTVASDKTATPFLSNLKEKTPAVIRWMRWVSASRLVLETNQSFPNHAGEDWTTTTGAIMAFDFDGKNSRILATPEDVKEFMPNA